MVVRDSFTACVKGVSVGFALGIDAKGQYVLVMDSNNKLVPFHEEVYDRARERFMANKRFHGLC